MSLMSIKIEAIFVSMKLLKTGISLVLSTLILLSSLRVSLTYTYYELDPIGFIERLCENKDKPELQCNGKCQLKKVTENNTENKNTPIKFTTLEEITLFVINELKINFLNSNSIDNRLFDYSNLYVFLCIDQIDRPPQA